MEPLDEGGLEAIVREAALGQLLLEAGDGHFGDFERVLMAGGWRRFNCRTA